MILAEQRSIRILHVVGWMDRGGLETWLMHILRHIDRDRFQMDFLVETTHKCAYDDEIRALGSQIIPCQHTHQPWIYASDFKQILREYGPYDIVHSHIHHYSGFVLRLARQAGVPVRIAHSHTNTSSVESNASLYRRLYIGLMQQWIARHATIGLAASRIAAADLFGSSWETDPRWRTFYCGIDLTSFKEFVDPIAVRAELGISPNAFVIGHVGRFVPLKNHTFLVDIVAEVARQEPRACLLLVGDGELLQNIQQKVDWLGLDNLVVFAGLRSDVPRLMLGAMNVFVLPSSYEGLPLVGIEAQAAGIPFIASDVVTQEVDVVKPLVRRLSLSQPASAWAEAILATRETDSQIDQAEALMLVKQNAFNIQNSIKDLEKLYLECFQYSVEHNR